MRPLFLLFAFMFSLAFSAVANANEELKYGVKLTEEKVLRLPEDGAKMYLSVYGDKNDPAFARIQSWFETTPDLKELKASTHFNMVTADSALYKERYASTVPALPCVRLQTADGLTVAQVSGKSIPMTGESLAVAMGTEFERCWRGRCTPRQPQPQPQPEPNAVPQIDINVQPDVSPASTDVAWGWVVLGGLIGGAAGLVQQWKATHSVPK